jgi:hypothetical protein
MKIMYSLLLLLASPVWAYNDARCELVSGIYANSRNSLQDLRFETLADIFTINNAKTLNMVLDGQHLRFLRTDLEVRKQTRMIFILNENNKSTRAATITLDRTPKEVLRSYEFYGNMIISPEVRNNDYGVLADSRNLLTFNFYCKL